MNRFGNSICILVLSAGVTCMPAESTVKCYNPLAYTIMQKIDNVLKEIRSYDESKPYNNGRRKLNQLPYLNLIGSIRKVDLPERSSQTGYL